MPCALPRKIEPDSRGFNGTMTLSDTRPSRRPTTASRPLPSPATGLPRLPGSPFQRAVPTTPADRPGASVGCFPVRTAFPVLQAGRHRHRPFRGLHRLHSRYGRWIARPPKAIFVTRLRPDQLLDQTARQLSDHRQFSEWNLPPQVIRTVGAHCNIKDVDRD